MANEPPAAEHGADQHPEYPHGLGVAIDDEGYAVTEEPLSGFGELKATLQIQPFRRLWAVLGLSSLGDWLGLLATSIFAAGQVSGSAAKGVAFGGVIAVRLLPALVLGPVAGVLADRFDRRLTMVVADLTRFVLFASIPAAALVFSNGALVVGWAAIATFIIETVAMLWVPAKEAAVPNLLPRNRLETANQLTLATTYGLTPVAAALTLAAMTAVLSKIYTAGPRSGLGPTDVALYFNALTFLAAALTVFFGIKEISGRGSSVRERQPGLLHQFLEGWRFVSRTPLVRGLVLGILGAFAGGGVVVGTARFYANSLGGGDSTFYLLFAMLFVGLAVGIVAGPRMIGALSRRRWFGMSIVLAAGSVALLALAWHLSLAVGGVLLVGVGAGMAFLSGTTLLGGEVDDEVRGRSFAFVQAGTRVVLMLTIAISSALVGVGGSPVLSIGELHIPISTTRVLLLLAGGVGIVTGLAAFRQMDDKPGVPVFADLISSLRGRPLGIPEPELRSGLFVVFEGGEGAGKSTQAELLAAMLRREGRDVVVTHEPGATKIGAHIRSLVLDHSPDSADLSEEAKAQVPPLAAVDGDGLSPRAEALLYAADRAHHVASLVRPALAEGKVVISDRYIDSSLAYQGSGRGLPEEEVNWLSSWATGGLRADLVVLLDVDPQVGLARAHERGMADRLEAESVGFHQRVRRTFLDLAGTDPGRYLVVDAELPKDVIAAAVASRVRPLLPEPSDRSAAPTTPDGVRPRPEQVPAPPPTGLGKADRNGPYAHRGHRYPDLPRPSDRMVNPATGATRTDRSF